MAELKIIWEQVKQRGYNCCANEGDQETSEEVGYLESAPDKKFARFRVWEAYYNRHTKGMDYKIISQQVIPLF